MQTALTLALLTALGAVAGTTEFNPRSTTQATRYCDRGLECVLLTHCHELQGLLQSQNRDDTIERLGLRCGNSTTGMVCCPTPHPLPTKGEPPTLPTTAPTTEKPITSPSTSLSAEKPPTPPIPSNTAPHSGEELLPSLCGNIPPLTRINLGTWAHVGEYPWSAVLGFRGKNDSDPLFWGCGGSLINERYVLTAAHCTNRRMTNDMQLAIVRLGEYDLDSDEQCYGTNPRSCTPTPAIQDFSPVEVVRHPDFNTRGVYSDDIALIRLDRAALLARHIGPVCLPAPGRTVSDMIKEFSPTGIGFEEKESGLRSARLRHVKLSLVPTKDCQSIYNSTMGTGEGQVCLGGQQAHNVCVHHPGAPVSLVPDIFDPYGGNLFVQVGITSYAALPCQQDVPALYTDVTHYRGWIVGNLRP